MVLSVGLVLFASGGRAQPREGIKAPVIQNSYARDKGQYGAVWKIYIEAEAGETDMAKVAAVAEQAGQGHYPTDFILLDPQYRRRLRGYLQWNTFSSKGLALKEGTQIVLRVSVIDRAGNESPEVLFPFTFMSGVKDQAKPPPPFDQENISRIGHIGIDLIGPEKDTVD